MKLRKLKQELLSLLWWSSRSSSKSCWHCYETRYKLLVPQSGFYLHCCRVCRKIIYTQPELHPHTETFSGFVVLGPKTNLVAIKNLGVVSLWMRPTFKPHRQQSWCRLMQIRLYNKSEWHLNIGKQKVRVQDSDLQMLMPQKSDAVRRTHYWW
jgi:hypothetical protein